MSAAATATATPSAIGASALQSLLEEARASPIMDVPGAATAGDCDDAFSEAAAPVAAIGASALQSLLEEARASPIMDVPGAATAGDDAVSEEAEAAPAGASSASSGSTMLCDINPHPRDSRIRFVDETHTYYIDGSSEGYLSTTTFIHKLFPGFNADQIIAKMMGGKNWTKSKYYGMTAEEIKAAWEENRDTAASEGTRNHANIESYYNGLPHETQSKEWSLFADFERENPHLLPYRSEHTIFAEDAKIAGSIDMVYALPDTDEIALYDWKFSKEIKFKNFFQKGTHWLTRGLDDCNFNHYSLQLGIYKYIYQRYYGFKVAETCLVILHKSQDKYQKIPTRNFDALVKDLMEERMEMVREDAEGERRAKRHKSSSVEYSSSSSSSSSPSEVVVSSPKP